MECRDVEAVLEQDGLSPLPAAAREHLVGCEGCRELLADLSAIVVAAKRIPAEENPPERIWISLSARLEAEGIIRESQAVTVSTAPAAPWWEGFAQWFKPRVLALAGAGVLAVAGGLYWVNHPAKISAPAVANVAKPAVTETQKSSELKTPVPESASPSTPVLSAGLLPKKPAARAAAAIASQPPQIHESTTNLRPSPSELASFGESAATLSQTERAMPSRALGSNAEVDAALRANLRTLNEFIAECEARLKENPRDQLTREYLNMALQQKAELLNAMMDSGRSEH